MNDLYSLSAESFVKAKVASILSTESVAPVLYEFGCNGILNRRRAAMTDVDLSRQNLGPTLDVIAWLFAAVATIVVFTRYYVRLSVKRSTGIDDWIILLTLVRPYILATNNPTSSTQTC